MKITMSKMKNAPYGGSNQSDAANENTSVFSDIELETSQKEMKKKWTDLPRAVEHLLVSL